MSAHLSPYLCYASLESNSGEEDRDEGGEGDEECDEEYEDPRQPIMEAFYSLTAKVQMCGS